MAVEKPDTRSKIIDAAAEIIGRERNLGLTIRDIAGRAEVNIASINYYFRSKENLVEEVERSHLETIRTIYTILSNETMDPGERLISWADKLMKHLVDYPGIIYLIGSRVLEKESPGLAEYLELLETDLTPVVKELTGINDAKTITFKVLQLISGVVYPVLIHTGTEKTSGLNIGSGRIRRKYLASLINSIKNTTTG